MKDLSPLPELLLFLLLFSYTSTAAAQAPGTFTPTGNMTTPRICHTATLLLNGKVLITGGSDSTHPGSYRTLASAELFDPNTGTFTATGNMTTRTYRSLGHSAGGRSRLDRGRQLPAPALLLIHWASRNCTIHPLELSQQRETWLDPRRAIRPRCLTAARS